MESPLYQRPVDGSGQTLAVSAATPASFTTVVPTSVTLAAITFNATAAPASPTAFFIRIGATPAAANKDLAVTIPTTGGVPTVVVRCAPGDKINIYSPVAGAAYCCWLTA